MVHIIAGMSTIEAHLKMDHNHTAPSTTPPRYFGSKRCHAQVCIQSRYASQVWRESAECSSLGWLLPLEPLAVVVQPLPPYLVKSAIKATSKKHAEWACWIDWLSVHARIAIQFEYDRGIRWGLESWLSSCSNMFFSFYCEVIFEIADQRFRHRMALRNL